MNSLERELASMKPRAPSDACRERIRQAMRKASPGETPPPAPRRRPPLLPWLAAAAGLVLLAAATLHLATAPHGEAPTAAAVDAPGQPVTRPVRRLFAHSEVIGEDDEGVEFVEGIGPARRYRVTTLDQVEYEFADTGERFWDILPGEHLVFVAVQLN